MLISRYGDLDLTKVVLGKEEFHPFPKASERQGWQAASTDTCAEWVYLGEKYLDFVWKPLTMELYLIYNRTGNNILYLKAFFERRAVLGILVLSECLEGKGRFLDQIINGIFCICEETTWMTPYDVSLKNVIIPSRGDRIVDLSCSETGALLAWTYYLFKDIFDEISPGICERIEKEIKERLNLLYMTHDDYWWMGFIETPYVNNWNPWCNRNMLMCFLTIENDPEVRAAAIHKIMRSLDVYLSKYSPDGCCEEGPMYWDAAGGGLHVCLQLLSMATSGRITIFDEQIVRDIGSYISKVHISGNYYVDFADGDAIVEINPSIYYFGVDVNDRSMINKGKNAKPSRPNISNWFGIFEYMRDILTEQNRLEALEDIKYRKDSWLWSAQVMTARERDDSDQGLYLACKGGHNAEPHNHNDIGNFLVYIDGKPLFIDLGTEEYNKKTFSKDRYDIWYTGSQFHNCPTINGMPQKGGAEYKTSFAEYVNSDAASELKMDIGRAYPEKAGVKTWVRTCRLNRGENSCVEIIDEFSLAMSSDDVSYHMMTPYCPVLTKEGTISLEYEASRFITLAYDCENLNFRYEKIDITEDRLRRNWGEVMYRIVLAEKAQIQTGIRRFIVKKN